MRGYSSTAFAGICGLALFQAVSASPLRSDAHKLGDMSWVNCGGGSDIVEIASVTISPSSNLSPGSRIVITAAGEVQKAIEVGTIAAEVQVDRNSISVDVNDLLADTQASFAYPIYHAYSYAKEVLIPLIPVSNVFTYTVEATGNDSDDLFCFELTIDLS